MHALTYGQFEFLAERNATGSGAGAPVGGGAGVGGGALRRVLFRLAAGVAGGALRLEHLPPEILPAQQSARDLLFAGDRRRRRRRASASFIRRHHFKSYAAFLETIVSREMAAGTEMAETS